MKRIILFLLLTGFFQIAHAQIVRGTIFDRSDSSVIAYAVIYISGTSTGTYSDINGNFELNISRNISKPITISMVGFYSLTLSEHSSNKSYKIYLTAKTNELGEVVVKGKRGNWETYLKIFKGQFLGTSGNALMCDILNEKDLRFVKMNDTSLSAYSVKPLIIHNKALGYDITYYLDKFIYSPRNDDKQNNKESCFILGNYLFKDELSSLNASSKKAVERRRRNVYSGSRMQFFRLLFSGDVKQRGKSTTALSERGSVRSVFIISTRPPSELKLVSNDSLSCYLKYDGALSVKYKGMDSKITFKKDSVYFEKYGFYDPFGIDFSGSMSNPRIGDLLPYDYELK
jgi:hypothetical protein